MGTGLELAKAYVTIRGDLSRLAGDLDEAQKITEQAVSGAGTAGGGAAKAAEAKNGLNDVSDGLTSVSSALDAMERNASKASLAMLSLQAAFAAMLYKTGSWIKNTLEGGSAVHDVYETIQTEMEQLTGSVEVAASVFKRLKDFAVETGIAVPTIYEMSRAFLRAGKNGEQTINVLRMLGDASGGTEQKFKQLVTTYQRMENGTMQFNRAFRMLSAQGILTIKDLAAYYKVSEHAARDMVKNGKVDFQEFKKILTSMTEVGGRFHGALGKMSNAGDRLSVSLAVASESLKEMLYAPLDPYLDALSKTITELTGHLTDFVEWGGKTLSFMTVGAAGGTLLAATVATMTAAFSALHAIAGPALAGLMGVAAVTLPEFAGVLVGMVAILAAVGAAFGFLSSVLHIPELIGAAWEYMKSVIERSGVIELIYTFMDIWDRLVEVVTIAVQQIWAIIEPFVSAIANAIDTAIMFLVKLPIHALQLMASFVLESFEWMLVFIEHWSEIWENAWSIAWASLLMLGDIFNNITQLWIDAVKLAMETILQTIAAAVAEMLVLLASVQKSLQFKSLSATEAQGIRDQAQKVAGFAGDAIGAKTGLGPLGERNMNTDILRQSSGTKDFIKGSGLEGLFSKMADSKVALEGRRRKRGKGGGPDGTAAPDEPDSESRDKPGIFGIEEFGRKLQQSILDPKTDRMVNAIEQGNQTQREVKEEVVKLNKRDWGLA